MVEIANQSDLAEPGGFVERYLEADGFRIRYLEAGQGPVLVHLHGAGGLRLRPAHHLLAEQYRVILFETPGFGYSAVNERSVSIPDLAATMAQAVDALGLTLYNLLGTSFGGKLALWLAIQHSNRVEALVLESPAAIRPEGHTRPSLPSEGRGQLLYAHPERQPPHRLNPTVLAQQEALVARLRGPNRDAELESRFPELQVPTLVLFGTQDRIIPPEMGRVYREKLPNCHFTLIYDAGHAIAADRPAAFSSLVSDFLDRREQFVVSRASSLLHP